MSWRLYRKFLPDVDPFRTLLRVSKEWRAFLEAMPRLWRHLDFSGARRPVSSNCIATNSRRARGLLTHLTLFRVSSKAHISQVLASAIGRNKQLEYLCLKDNVANESLRTLLPSAKNLRSLVITSGTTPDCVSALLDRCPNLSRAEFHSICVPPSEGFAPALRLIRLEVERILQNLRILVLKVNTGSHTLSAPRLVSILVHFKSNTFPSNSSTGEAYRTIVGVVLCQHTSLDATSN